MEKESLHQKVLHIKNMVCPRCIKVVRDEMENLGLRVIGVELGRTIIEEQDGKIDENAIEAALVRNGFELLHNKREELVEQVKLKVIDLVYNDKLPHLKTTVSTYLAKTLSKDYSTISTAFKISEAMDLNRYVVLQKIERAKELLAYKELSLSEIAIRLGYRSLQHLSNQFKEVTGTTLNKYKRQGGADRQSIDNLY
ncbi:helix-turn-helix transcriptional regulator [Pontibacter sp. 172403-2]|uniref:AraC family transcriptional regulator n=1 Tax=Pontibacter rufus TaxID=2791028 RepID=UPI0018AFF29F|nr:AraC family transcriptional regulator [Pontibacter sp. 172403-2]MBF9252203.1 helix-turn-helix transcriptional regulator [Pontibacter sp. 172403-2]